MSEKEFIRYLMSQFQTPANLVGIGDDCAVIPLENEMAWLVTTDALVEGIHFLKNQIPPSEAGYKLVAANVSDISSKGGTPKYAFLTAAIPKDIGNKWLTSVVQGIKVACEQWDIQILGGDSVGSKKDIFLSLTLIGIAERSKIKCRNMAEPGDIICVTGCLGDSGGGLKILQNNLPRSPAAQKLVYAHFHPQPHLEEGKWLSACDEVHAMMDISDGLHCDLRRLLAASNCGGTVEITRLPISERLRNVSVEYGWDAIEIGLTGGEDYCLLLTIAHDSAEKICKAFKEAFERQLFEVGQVRDSPGLDYQKEGILIPLKLSHFEHF